jgi:hypothetical protein
MPYDTTQLSCSGKPSRQVGLETHARYVALLGMLAQRLQGRAMLSDVLQ